MTLRHTLLVAAIVPAYYAYKNYDKNRSHYKRKFQNFLNIISPENLEKLKLSESQKDEIKSIMKNHRTQSHSEIRDILNPEQLEIYDKINHKADENFVTRHVNKHNNPLREFDGLDSNLATNRDPIKAI